MTGYEYGNFSEEDYEEEHKYSHGLCGHSIEKLPTKWVSFHDEDTILLIKTEVDHTNTAHITETLTIDRKTGELK